MAPAAPRSFGAELKALREAAGYTQEELATIAGLSVHAISALERGERRRPHVETVRALSAALDLTGARRDAFVRRARATTEDTAADELSGISLPLALTEMLGRERDVHTLRGWLADPTARVITVLGPGGVGKTRLAVELARAIADEGTTRVVFAPLATIQDPGLAACAIAEALGLADISASDLPTRARAACAGCPTLLVLDNLEQVHRAARLVSELVTSAADLRVLATSRAPLGLRGEREYTLGPLTLEAGVETMSPAELVRVPAVRLFLDRVRDVQPEFALTPENGHTVAAICQRLDTLPLALELAAPWIKALTAEALLQRLADDVLLSTATVRDLPERQQTMAATVAWSYQLLGPNERRAFRRIGALPGEFSIDAAAALLTGRDRSSSSDDEALAAIAALIDKSLLQRADSSVPARTLYRMLETVRAYAARELAPGEHEDAMEGLVRYCTSEASRAAEALVGPSQVEWLDRVHDDLPNYRAAVMWLIERRRPGEVADIVWGLLTFWFIRGYAAEGRWWFEETLKLPSLPPDAERRALVGAASMWYAHRELDRARTAFERAMTLARDAGDGGLIAVAGVFLGHVEYAAGRLDAAREQFTNSVAAFRVLAVPWGIGNSLTGLALVAGATGDRDDAERLLDEATTALRQSGPWYLSLVLTARAILAISRGDADAASAFAREALTHTRELHDKFAFVHALAPLAAAAILKGDDTSAARILGARDAVTERTGAVVVDQAIHDLCAQVERQARARLRSERWLESYAAGRTLSIDALLKDIDIRSAVVE